MFKYGIEKLTVNKAIAIAKGELKAVLTPEANKKVNDCRHKVETMASSKKAVYGINTGFGPLCDVQITPKETGQLQENLLMTHAVGVGKPIEKNLSKIMMICKVHALCQGFSGIRLKVIERIVYFIENDLLPVVPEQGSVGASGDLAPLAHLFLPLLGEGEFWDNGNIKWITLKEIGEIAMCKRIFKNQTTSNGEIPFYTIGTFGNQPKSFISKEIYDSRYYPFHSVLYLTYYVPYACS